MDVSDASLVAESLTGNRDVFGQIVTRYQTLICSMAYSRTGDLSQSEDLTQETFISAWKQLATLREPEKLRSKLCGIARHRIFDAVKKMVASQAAARRNWLWRNNCPVPGRCRMNLP